MLGRKKKLKVRKGKRIVQRRGFVRLPSNHVLDLHPIKDEFYMILIIVFILFILMVISTTFSILWTDCCLCIVNCLKSAFSYVLD